MLPVVDPVDTGDEDLLHLTRRHPSNGRPQIWVEEVCDDTVENGGWAYRDALPSDLFAGPLAEVRRLVNTPEPDLSPPAETPVNFGVWLAVEAHDPVVADANLFGYYSEVTATQAQTTFTIDDGEPIVCDGIGTPIVDIETIEQGACGYTFRTVDELGERSIAIPTRWTVSYRTSFGSGNLDDMVRLDNMVRTVTIPYTMYEIVTVGVSN